ncbi:Nuf2 family-domain-containing protein [Zopfochytrium polystomum]|nr:Nuf2 family-domain-containing protein [Zopfochytrium polystomum]
MATSAATNPFSFPLLKPSEVLACLQELGLQVSMEDLERPNAVRMTTVYESFTDTLMGLSREQFAQPSYAALEVLDYPDLHMETLALMGFFRQLVKLICDVGLGDISIRDVVKPEPGRVRRILSAIINFTKFRGERIGEFEKCVAEQAEYYKQKEDLHEQRRELADVVNSLRLQRAEEEPDVHIVKEETAPLSSTLKELDATRNTMTARIEVLKKTRADAVEKRSNMRNTSIKTDDDIAKLKSRIIQSPEKLQQELVDLAQNVQSDKCALDEVEKVTRKHHSKMDLLTPVYQDVSLCSKLFENCEMETKKAAAASASTWAEKEDLERRETELGDLQNKDQLVKRQQQHAEEKSARVKQQIQARRKERDVRITELKQESEMTLRERELRQHDIDEANSAAAEAEAKLMDLRKKMDLDVQSYRDEFGKLRKRADDYRNALAKAMADAQLK